MVCGQQQARLLWLQHLQLDWEEICTVQLSLLQEVLEQRAEVFREELSTLKNHKSVIRVDASVLPKFCKSAFSALCPGTKVGQELDRLLVEGISELVQYAEWAAPIAQVFEERSLNSRLR